MMFKKGSLTRRAAIRSLGATGLATIASTPSSLAQSQTEIVRERFQPTIDRLRNDLDVIAAVHEDRLAVADELEALLAGSDHSGVTPAIARPVHSPIARIDLLLEELRIAMSEHYPGAGIQATFNHVRPEHVSGGSVACVMVLASTPWSE